MEKKERRCVKVLVDRAVYGLSEPLTYFLPPELEEEACVGKAVLVPLGGGWAPGYIAEFEDSPSEELEEIKPVRCLLPEVPQVSEGMFSLARRLSEYFCEPGAALVKCILPRGAEARLGRQVVLVKEKIEPKEEDELVEALSRRGGRVLASELEEELGMEKFEKLLCRAKRRRWVKVDVAIGPPKVKPVTRLAAELTVSPQRAFEEAERMERRAPKASQILQLLAGKGGRAVIIVDMERELGRVRSSVSVLEKRDLARRIPVEIRRIPYAWLSGRAGVPRLTEEQEGAARRICESVERGEGRSFLLFGVTGSGKSEVYWKAIEHVVSQGGQAIVLLPEIALTTQLVRQLRTRLGGLVAVLHSGLSLGERFDEWRRVAQGEARVVVGPRSAAFAPVEELDLIVMDEEQDDSYKQGHMPHYHTRVVVEERAKDSGATLVFVSATPAVETFYRAQQGELELLEMRERVFGAPLPEVMVVDMREEESRIASKALEEALAERLSKGEQVVLFVNRRGYAGTILCRECGFVLKCPNCEVTLTFHRGRVSMLCHHCGHRERPPRVCPSCGGVRFTGIGVGTEQVVEWVRRRFSTARVARLDRDVMSRKEAHFKVIEGMERGEIDVLVGTQLVAKGHHFPKVTLVGVINADVALHLPEFRAAERTFQLLVQVAGRAGREELAGKVIVQTYNPEHYSVGAAKEQDYRAFFEQEIAYREELRYPPFSYLAKVEGRGEEEEEARWAVERVAEFVPRSEGVEVLGPAPCPISRLRGKWRWHFLVKAPSAEARSWALKAALEAAPRVATERVFVDVEPVSLL